MVAITGNVPRAIIGRDAFQEADITGITLPVTKHNFLVRSARSCRMPFGPRSTSPPRADPVPCWSTFRKTWASRSWTSYIRNRRLPGYKPTYKGHIRQIMAAAKAIAEAKRPLLYVGGGAIASGAHAEYAPSRKNAICP